MKTPIVVAPVADEAVQCQNIFAHLRDYIERSEEFDSQSAGVMSMHIKRCKTCQAEYAKIYRQQAGD